jgi:hypothetical protein
MQLTQNDKYDVTPGHSMSADRSGFSKAPLTNNGMAMTGFILGLVSVVFYVIGILPILAVIFSAVGLGTFKSHVQKNRWMAITGLILGILYTLAYMAAYNRI